ncbi:exo-beta-N-acetylmuramidase NamZ domain-containing protein [Caldalkalibacillus salinus]|uniref:exo-beta-N-acetylmuramidase NamZ family protein n=1 Tax=Caldalkalibacillus salinus TaxID=2803787 RepID=UPI001922AABC|nr:DUF1343 domain-containing protein [Caldalkalibacillus salinus]
MQKRSHEDRVQPSRMDSEQQRTSVDVKRRNDNEGPAVRTGLQRLLDKDAHNEREARLYEELRRKKIGLIMNHTSVDDQLKLSVDRLLAQGYEVVALFAPEHGIRGQKPAGAHVKHHIDPITQIPVYSLYGQTKQPTTEMLEDLDCLIYDIQDLGVRYYTYIYTLILAMKAASENALSFVVLDRPNPVTGTQIEGNRINPAFDSFVGGYHLPIRHGLTVGELARYMHAHLQLRCDLSVIPMEGWCRRDWYDQTGLPWTMPSPNATGLDMALLYAGTCLFEGTNVSEGRGTTKPFEWIGAPWITAQEWKEALDTYKLEGVQFRPVAFQPTTSKYQDALCSGVHVHISDRERMHPTRVGLTMLETLSALYPQHFKWQDPIKNRYFIDLLLGTDQVRKSLNAKRPVQAWLAEEEVSLTSYMEETKPYQLYES